MRFLRPTAIIAAILIVAMSIPPPLFSQTAPRRRQTSRSLRADAIAPAINELLKLDPITPQSPDEKDSENTNAKSEMAEAVEAYAKTAVTEAREQKIDQTESGATEKPLPLKVSIGRILSESKTIEATEGLVLRLIERAKSLRESQPVVARQILSSIEGVSLPIAEVNLVERIGAGWVDIDALKIALENRDSLRKSAGDELYGLIKPLSKAAESYLEVEDGAEARKLVLARHRGGAYILGDITALSYDPYLEASRKWEEKK